MNYDAVAIGSAITVIISVVIVVFLWYKVKKLMEQDAQNNRR